MVAGRSHASGRPLFDGADGSYRMTGIRFIGLDDEEAARIASYVAVHAPQADEDAS